MVQVGDLVSYFYTYQPSSYNLPKLNLKEAESLNRLITPSEIEAVIKKNSQHTKTPDQMASQASFIEYLKNSYLLKLLQKIQEEGRFSNSF